MTLGLAHWSIPWALGFKRREQFEKIHTTKRKGKLLKQCPRFIEITNCPRIWQITYNISCSKTNYSLIVMWSTKSVEHHQILAHCPFIAGEMLQKCENSLSQITKK